MALETVRKKKKRATLYRQQGGCCFYCGLELHHGVRYGLDHLSPQSLGGSHKNTNLVVACHRCNKAKGAMTLEEFRAYRRVQWFAGEKTRFSCQLMQIPVITEEP